MPESCRERVDTAKLIKGILDSYPENAILRELLQNSDDAGATSQIFILDNRTHGVQLLIDPVLKNTQGPSLLAVNDSVFRKDDWNALRTLHGSNKTADEMKTGKYGLGFRACYHVTDNPHILSQKKLVIFDPHEELSAPFQGGVTVDIIDEGSLYAHQLEAFGAAAPDLTSPFQGTIVRLPLRTPAQACRSRIKPTATTPDDIRQYFVKFAESELSVTMLFLKHIKSIELREITPDGKMKIIGTAARIDDENIGDRHTGIFSRGLVARHETFRIRIKTDCSAGTTWRIYDSVLDAAETSRLISARLNYDVGAKLVDDKLFSHVALAIPLDSQPCKGRLFTLLPLPIYPEFPLHIHGIFALTPDRQNLRNKEDTGMSAHSREQLLVEWNHTIFDRFVPSSWAKLLAILVQEDNVPDIWSAWPQKMDEDHASTSSYWSGTSRKLLKAVISTGLPVFPTTSSIPSHVSLDDALVAAPSDDPELLEALAGVGITIIQPPAHVYYLLEDSEFKRVDPEHVHKVLLGRLAEIGSSSSAHKEVILNYLVLTPPKELNNVVGLPLIPLVSGKRATLRLVETGSINHVLASTQEAGLYGEYDERMVALADMPDEVQKVFCSPQAGPLVNVILLGIDHVSQYLHAMFGHFNPAVDEIEGAEAATKLKWLVDFWTWMNTWTLAMDLIPQVQQFHLLPTVTGGLRKVSSRILLHTGIRETEISALGRVGVPFLHPSIPPPTFFSTLCGVQSSNMLSFVLDLISLDKLAQDSRTALQIQKFFIRFLQNGPKLVKLDRAKFIQLPIFPIRNPLPHLKSKPTIRGTGAVLGEQIFVCVGDDCPLPVAPPHRTWTFVDVSGNGRVLALVVDSNAVKNACDELGVLEKAIPCLEDQPPALLDVLGARIMARILDISQESQNRLRDIRFVLVNGTQQRSTPRNVIDPESALAPLFRGEVGRFPEGRFREGQFLSVMQSQNFFQRALTLEIVADRISYLANSNADDPATFEKAHVLLKLLDTCWLPQFSTVISGSKVAWLPTTKKCLRRPDQCRDMKEDNCLFDLVLDVVDAKLISAGLREALGWIGGIPLDVLVSQFRSTIDDVRLRERAERLMKLIKSMATHSASRGIDFGTLRSIVGRQPWIPLARNELVATHHAVLSVGVALGGSYKSVPRSLAEGKCGEFLTCMGCTNRPTLESLIDEVDRLATGLLDVFQMLPILEEIARHQSNLTDSHRARLFVPDARGVFRNVGEVYFNDMPAFAESAHVHGFPTHATLSKSLASGLSIRFLSSLELGEAEDEDEDEDDEDLREDLTTRIHGVLNDYDIQYALNEFLANAADAGASRFSVLLDERSFENKTVISPEMAEFQAGPALVLFNDGVFSPKDFSGLIRIGQGGKTGLSDTIGRFGLGALSLFHFSEVPMLISGGYVVFLDPNATHLPLRKGRKRTSLKRPLTTLIRKYRDQISPLESLFGFSLTDSEYNGTLFRLPLRSTTSLLSTKCLRGSDCLNLLKGSYYDLAQSALFFTDLKQITAGHHPPIGKCSSLWSVSVKRFERSTFEESFHLQNITLQLEASDHPVTTEDWLITGSVTSLASVPVEHSAVLSGLKLVSCLHVRMALRRRHPHRGGCLFSSVRLPQTVSLPLHLDSRFALASDRRSIRFDPADSTGHRIPESAYNAWILCHLVPPLYMFSLHHIASPSNSSARAKDNGPWWPEDANDDMTREIVASFYRLLPMSRSRICWTASHHLILPKEAVFQGKEPLEIIRVLSMLKTPRYIPLGRKVRRHVLETQLPAVNADFVKTVIQHGGTKFMDLFNVKGFNLHDVGSVVRFLLEGNVSLVDLPLLPLADGSITTFRSPGNYLIYHSDHDLTSIFPSARFINPNFDGNTIQLLVQAPDLNVKIFEALGVSALIRDRLQVAPRSKLSTLDVLWIQQFWKCYHNLPDSLGTCIGDLPLVPTYDGLEFVSSDYCKDHPVLPYPSSLQWLIPIATKLNILVLKEIPLTSFPLDLFSFNKFLQCIETRETLLTTNLSGIEHNEIAKWIRRESQTFVQNLSSTLGVTLSRLPVWHARVNGSSQLIAATDIQMLPIHTSLEVFSKYINPVMAVAEYSSELQICMHRCLLNRGPMNSLQLIRHLRYPAKLPVNELNDFYAFLNAMLSFTGSIIGVDLMVPNREYTLVPVKALYDDSIPLFAAAFGNSQTSFVHEHFRGLRYHLRTVGLLHAVTFNSFLMCARQIHAFQERFPADDNIVNRAMTVSECYHLELPSLIMSDSNKWEQLNIIRFIPRDMRRHRVASYAAESYCRQLPAIVSPIELVLDAFESVVWTQRGLFVTQPPANLVALNPSFGIPFAEEVVAHLVVLALHIAPEHPRNRSLLQDIYSTYEWLNQHYDDALIHLLKHEDDALFLNVDDPNDPNSAWEWHSSNKLVLNLHYDEKDLVGVRNFLIPFRQLLLAAGVTSLSDPKFVPNEPQSEEDGIRAVFNSMRKNCELTDIVLMPTLVDTEVVVDRLRAHASFLVAAIPHLRLALLGDWTESKSREIEFQGSYFGACAVLDFVYTGEIPIQDFQDGEEAMEVLRELLELLERAELWDMQDLKAKLEWLIADELKFVSPDTYATILQHAELHNATSLVRYCQDFEIENWLLLQALSNEESTLS